MSPATKPDAPRTGASHIDRFAAQLACAGASVAYLCLGVVILLRQPMSHTRLALGLAGVCAVSLLLAGIAHALTPGSRER